MFSEDFLGEALIALPTAPGSYYFKAYSPGNSNYLPIESDWIPFSILAVKAVRFYTRLDKTEFLAFEALECGDISCFIECNDGNVFEIPFEDIRIIYNGYDSLRAADEEITVQYMSFSDTKGVKVYKRDFDLSKVKWEGLLSVYDGEEKNAYLSNLPKGLEAIYEGNGNVSAGEYTVTAIFSYDEKNYNPPQIEDGVMIVERRVIPLPEIQSAEYTSEILTPKLEESPYYTYSFDGESGVGEYEIVFTLTDTENTCFEDGKTECKQVFRITKRPLTVRISDVESYFLGRRSEPKYEIISGTLLPGEVLKPSYSITSDTVTAEFDEPNYDITVIDGKVVEYRRLSPKDSKRAALLSVIFLIFLLVSVTVIVNRKRIYAYYMRIYSKGENFIPSMPIISEQSTEPIVEEDCEKRPIEEDGRVDIQFLESENNEIEECEDIPISVIDAKYADLAITDSLAKNLIRKDINIITSGKSRRIINVDTLSRSFNSGDRVDVNILKEKSLIPYDTAYIKVLARGIIDKPLEIYANDFSLTAVKMIALCGGKAIKVGRSKKN